MCVRLLQHLSSFILILLVNYLFTFIIIIFNLLTSDTAARAKSNQKHTEISVNLASNKPCAWGHDTPPPLSSLAGAQVPHAPPSRRNVAVDSRAQYVLAVSAATASRVKTAVSKAAW